MSHEENNPRTSGRGAINYTPLTDDQIYALSNDSYQGGYVPPIINFGRSIEAAATAPLLERIGLLLEKLREADEHQDELQADNERLQAALAEAIPAMREYARKNPKHHFSPDGLEQDPNGVHAWLAKNDPSMKGTP